MVDDLRLDDDVASAHVVPVSIEPGARPSASERAAARRSETLTWSFSARIPPSTSAT